MSSSVTMGAPPGAHLGIAIARALKDAMDTRGISAREAARQAGLGTTHPTVLDTLQGKRLPATHTVLLLEIALRTLLYPSELYAQLEAEEPGPGGTGA
ncbi:hypothetical protein [Kitasatospora sp. MBT66]|uniref:hypothetical protein n=1 Tax=Kitasatospora sp. MBT66 TaxID=1444769 RepID=UPI0011EA6A9B|nr:hypothetical protein [Kitasatospora sp. MBT66]